MRVFLSPVGLKLCFQRLSACSLGGQHYPFLRKLVIPMGTAVEYFAA